jgi:hypothetical protein
MKISFDWDSCLAEDRQQKIAKKFISNGDEVWIVTSRMSNPHPATGWDNKIVFKVARNLGIPDSRVIFTNAQDKWITLEKLDMDIHFDDDQIEIELMEENDIKCIGVLILDP